jgi:hypothetical protein
MSTADSEGDESWVAGGCRASGSMASPAQKRGWTPLGHLHVLLLIPNSEGDGRDGRQRRWMMAALYAGFPGNLLISLTFASALYLQGSNTYDVFLSLVNKLELLDAHDVCTRLKD